VTVDLVVRLTETLPAGRVIDDPALVAAQATDASRHPAPRAALVVRPRTAEEVSAVLRVANATGTPVVPQGARTGLVGGSAAIEGAILLDLTSMDAILDIDVVEGTAVVQPGVIVAELQRVAAERGLFYAPDPASAEWATVGGTIATNAGGMRCIRYGVTRDAVLSLQIVLADGSIERTRPATVKGVAGLDLTSLVVGSEGTLAVVTEATVRLLPAPGPARGVLGLFPSTAAALAAAAAITSGSRLPSTLEFLDDTALRGIRIARPDIALDPDARSWLLAVTDAIEGADHDLDHFSAVFADHGALSVDRADDEQQLDGLLAARRALNPGLQVLWGDATHGDLAVPRSRLAAFAEEAERIARETGAEISLAGHVGDGNLHPTVVYDGSDPVATDAAHRAAGQLLRLAQSLGGTVAGEHGVGTVKLADVDGELSGRLRGLQREIKRVFDPRGILNPGRKL
jgi:glycolate oxidase